MSTVHPIKSPNKPAALPALQLEQVDPAPKRPVGFLPATGFIRQAQLIPHILPFSSATLWRMIKKKTFVAPVRLSERVTAWSCEEVRLWIEARAKGDAK